MNKAAPTHDLFVPKREGEERFIDENLIYSKETITKSRNSTPVFLNLISGMKYVHLLTENSLVKVGVLQKIFRFLEIHITE